MRRMWHRCPGKILALMMGGRRLGGGRTWREAGRRAEGGAAEGGGRRAEDGGRRAGSEDGATGTDRRADDGGGGRAVGRDRSERARHAGDCGSGGPVAAGGSGAAVDIGRETQADGTRSVPATPNGKGRGWDSVVVEESDILACGGYLPEKYLGGAGENDHDSEAEPAAALPDDVPNPGTASSESEEGGTCDTHLNASGAGEVTQEGPAEDADAGVR